MKNNFRYIWFCILIFLTISPDSVGQEISKDTEQIAKKIQKLRYLFIDGEPSTRSIELAKELFKISSDLELIELTKSENAMVVCFSCWVLAKKNNPIVAEICNKFESYGLGKPLVNINKTKTRSSFILIETYSNLICTLSMRTRMLELL